MAYGEEVEVAAIAADGRRFLTVRDVGTAEVWDAASGEKVGEIRPDSPLRGTAAPPPHGHAFKVFIESAALNRDGSAALLGLNDGTAGIFRVADGARLATLHPPDEAPAEAGSVIRCVEYSQDGTLALVGFRSRAVGVWSEHGERVGFLASTAGARLIGGRGLRDTLVCSVAVSADRRRVFGGCADMTAVLWDLETGEVVLEALEHAEEILAVFDGPEGFGWATTAGNVWGARDGGAAGKLISSGEHWETVVFHRDRFLARGFGGALGCWSLSGEHTPLGEPQHSYEAIRARRILEFSGKGDFLYAESRRRFVVVAGGQTTIIERDDPIARLQFSPRGDAIVIRGRAGEIELRGLPGDTLVRAFAPPGGAGAFAFSPDGDRIAVVESGGEGGPLARHVFIYDTVTGREVDRHPVDDSSIFQVVFSPDGRWLATRGNAIFLWRLDPGEPGSRIPVRLEVERDTVGMQFLRDGRLLVVVAGRPGVFQGEERVPGRARVFRGEAQVSDFEVPIDPGTPWCVSDDGRTLTVAIDRGVVRFDLETGRPRGTWATPHLRPEHLLEAKLEERVGIRGGGLLWRTEHGVFLHQGDGPRGGLGRYHLSERLEVVLPARDGAAVIALAPEPALLGIVPFEGRLRASRIVGDEVLLVSAAGRLFRSRRPAARGG